MGNTESKKSPTFLKPHPQKKPKVASIHYRDRSRTCINHSDLKGNDHENERPFSIKYHKKTWLSNLTSKFAFRSNESERLIKIQKLQTQKNLQINENLRKSFLNKLISKNQWEPQSKPLRYNSLIIFDWDDTILPTSFLNTDNLDEIELSFQDKLKFDQIEEYAIKIFTICSSKGNTYIVTNSQTGWVNYSCDKFFPNLKIFLNNVNIISSRDKYENEFPYMPKKWKILTFFEIMEKYNDDMITNIISIGDSDNEIFAAKKLAEGIKFSVVKTVKMKSKPSLDDISEQLKQIRNDFEKIFVSGESISLALDNKST